MTSGRPGSPGPPGVNAPGSGHDHRSGGHAQPEHVHGKGGRLRRWWEALRHPHSHDPADSIDDALLVSRAGTRALAISLVGLALTALIQAIVFVLSHSVGLLADTIHNATDALTALPLGVAFVVGRRRPTARYTYGYGRAEDLAGLSVILVMTVSAVVTAWEAIDRLVNPRPVGDLVLVGLAGVVGFVGNELAARYRITVGARIGSAALIADGKHARTDGLTSLAVVAGAAGVAAGWQQADPIVGLLITVAILGVLRTSARDIYHRLMDAVDPELTRQAALEAGTVGGVERVDEVRIRWIGHELRAELAITVAGTISVAVAHDIAEEVRHRLLHRLHRLTDVNVHTDPAPRDDLDAHRVTAHHAPVGPPPRSKGIPRRVRNRPQRPAP